jgi:acetyltransferase-like isoleucine patch superfamily enzyme
VLDSPVVACLAVLAAISTTATAVIDAACVGRHRARGMTARAGLHSLGKVMVILVGLALLPGNASPEAVCSLVLVAWALPGLLSAAGSLQWLQRTDLGRGTTSSRGIIAELRSLGGLAHHHIAAIAGQLPALALPLLIAVRLGPEQASYFNVAWMVGGVCFMVSPAVAAALLAGGASDPDKVIERTKVAAIITAAILIGPVGVFLFAGREVLSVFGPAYGTAGAGLLFALTVSAAPDGVTNLAVSVLRVKGRLRSVSALNSSMAAIAIVFTWVAAPSLGIASAGWGWVLAQSLGAVVIGAAAFRGRRTREVSIVSATVAGPKAGLRLSGSGTIRPAPPSGPSRRFTIRNLAALARYLRLKVAHRHQLRGGAFFLGRGGEIRITAGARVDIGARFRAMPDFDGSLHGRVQIGNDVFFNRACHVAVQESLVIGNGCLFGEKVSIHDEDHLFGFEYVDTALPQRPMRTAGIVIGDNVWVGAKATILQGVIIGDGAVVGAHALVTKDVPPHSLVVGAPARVIRSWALEDRPTEIAC